jgi:hypothetical protein
MRIIILKPKFALCFLFSALCCCSCKKLVEAPVPSELIADENVYSTDATSIAVFNGIYAGMNTNSQPFQGNRSISLLTALSGDEYIVSAGALSSNLYSSYYNNALTQQTGTVVSGAECWAPMYNYIFRCNAAIEGLTTSTGLSPALKQQLLGEAYFLRAFYFFYLVNLFGNVPLPLTTDPNVNSKLTRSSTEEVYHQIIADLLNAEGLLSDKYLDGSLSSATSERVRPTHWAAVAMLARVYLYTGDWVNAEAKATEIISNTTLFSLASSLNDVFLKFSPEAIWEIQPTAINFNTQEAQTLVIPQTGPTGTNNPVVLSKLLLNSFELGDQRAVYGNWIDTTIYKVSTGINDTVIYVNKYKQNAMDTTIKSTTSMKEYFMVLRLGEQYLIRSEARAQQGKIGDAQADINAIRKRAFLVSKPIIVSDKSGLLTAIWHERQVELFGEWGHRWFDLKRSGKVDEVMKSITPIKSNGSNSWQSYMQWYPLPLKELQKAPNLIQNDGYN